MRLTRVLVLGGVATVLVAAVAATSCRVHTKASSDVRVGADYRVRAYAVRTPLRIAGENVRDWATGAAPPPGRTTGTRPGSSRESLPTT